MLRRRDVEVNSVGFTGKAMYLSVPFGCVIVPQFHVLEETGHSSTYHVVRERTRPAILMTAACLRNSLHDDTFVLELCV